MVFTDPVLTPLLVIGVFVYYALQSLFSSKEKPYDKERHERFMQWLKEEEEKRSPENIRYQKWLYDHRPDDICNDPQTDCQPKQTAPPKIENKRTIWIF